MNSWDHLIAEWSTALRAARRAQGTIDLRTYQIGRLARWAGPVDPWSLTLDDLTRWTGSQAWDRDTARSYRSALRGFWAWGVGTGRVAVNVADALPVIAPKQPRPKPAPRGLVDYALRDPDERVRLMVWMADDLGLRRAEVACGASWDLVEDLHGWSLRVHGKGSRERVLPLPDDLGRALRRLGPGYFFPGRENGHLSAKWVGKLVRNAMRGEATMHQLRHGFATDLHRRTKDLPMVREALGHASLATTQRYVDVDRDEMRAAMSARSSDWRTRRGAA